MSEAGKADSAATAEMLERLRQGDESGNGGRDPRAPHVEASARSRSWDGLMAGAAELKLKIRNPGILAVHAVTTANTMRYLYEHMKNDETRRVLLL